MLAHSMVFIGQQRSGCHQIKLNCTSCTIEWLHCWYRLAACLSFCAPRWRPDKQQCLLWLQAFAW